MHILMKYFFYSFLLMLTGLSAQKKKITHEQVWAKTTAYAGEYNPSVDTKTLDNKVMCGYQGWFNAEGDGANYGWRHYGGRKFGPGSCTFEYWPDMSELSDSEKYPTPFKYADGSTAHLFSSYNQQTVERHFKWMQDYGIDGVFLQRFGITVKEPRALRCAMQSLEMFNLALINMVEPGRICMTSADLRKARLSLLSWKIGRASSIK